jgi:hypothetical protein
MNCRQKRTDDEHQQIDFHVFSRCGAKDLLFGPVMVLKRWKRLPVQ